MDHDPRKPLRENLGPAQTRRPDEERDEIAASVYALLTQGLNDTQIGERLGISRKAVAYYRKKSSGVAKKSPLGMVQRGTENDRVQFEILRLHYEGLTYVEIAEQVGLSWETVRARLRKEMAKGLADKRDEVAGQAFADMQVMRLELLDIIIRSDTDIDIDHDEMIEALSEGKYDTILEKVSNKNKAALEAKFKAMEVLIKLMDREAKQFGTNADQNVNVNHNVKVDPQAIELLGRLEQVQEIDNVVDAEVVDDFNMGNL